MKEALDMEYTIHYNGQDDIELSCNSCYPMKKLGVVITILHDAVLLFVIKSYRSNYTTQKPPLSPTIF